LTSGGNRAAMAIDYLAADREPDAAPLILIRAVQTLKGLKYTLGVAIFEADAVIGNGNLDIWQTGRGPASHKLGAGANRYLRQPIGVAVLDGVW
jgi:hypothetical protein